MTSPQATRRHFLSVNDLSDEDLARIVGRGAEHASGIVREQPLHGVVVGTFFRVTSTRTRSAFSVATMRLGGQVLNYAAGDLQLATGESLQDTGRVMASMLDVLVARTAGPAGELAMIASQGRMAVVNAMTDTEHPTQAMADLVTMLRRFGTLDGLHVLYVGEGNSTAVALALALSRFPSTRLYLRTPPGYGVSPDVLARAERNARRSGSLVEQRHDMDDIPAPVDVVYTTRWCTTGSVKQDPDWRARFRPFHVDDDVMEASKAPAFMHDLPAHRGQEVSADVLDGGLSIAFEQAENKLHSAKAVLEWCSGRL